MRNWWLAFILMCIPITVEALEVKRQGNSGKYIVVFDKDEQPAVNAQADT